MDIFHGNCLDHMLFMEDNSVDAIVTDPPYGLSFMGKKWDYDVPGVDIWTECLRVLKPGGHLLVFAGTRTQHRMAVRIEDAGFEIRDMIAWVYGSGFPKSLDVSKALDKVAGAEREVVGIDHRYVGMSDRAKRALGTIAPGKSQGFVGDPSQITAPATDAARQWQGWGTALKPALEPVTVARKPLIGTVAGNVLTHGTGALNIDGCRVGDEPTTRIQGVAEIGFHGGNYAPGLQTGSEMGRWPANLIHDGSDEVLAAFPHASGAVAPVRGSEASAKTANAFGKYSGRAPSDQRDGGGSAARFFYCAKASRKDRNEGLHADLEARNGNHHPTVKPTDLMAYLCRLVTPPGGLVYDPFMGSGSTGKAAVREGLRFAGSEMQAEYITIARARIAAAMTGGAA